MLHFLGQFLPARDHDEGPTPFFGGPVRDRDLLRSDAERDADYLVGKADRPADRERGEPPRFVSFFTYTHL